MIYETSQRFIPIYKNGGSPEPPAPDYSTMPVTLRSNGNTQLSITKYGNAYSFSAVYKIDNGQWSDYTLNTAISLTDGQTVSFSGNNTYGMGNNSNNHNQFTTSGDGTLFVFGNWMSFYGFEGNMPYRGGNQSFYNCTNLVDASNLILPSAIAQYDRSMWEMFKGCTNLTAGPFVPGTTNANYREFFAGCTNLATISCSLTNWTDFYTVSWVQGVASNGTFYCPAALGNNSNITRGNDYCPANWTVVNI